MKYFVLSVVLAFAVGLAKGQDVIQVPDPDNAGETIDCGLEGTANKNSKTKPGKLAWIGNPHKNRWDFPEPAKIKKMKIEDLIASDADKSKFKAGTPVEVTAYVFNVKKGGQETCNCKTKSINFVDSHIELTPDSEHTSAKERLIVEVTPRIRSAMTDKGFDWSTHGLKNDILGRIVTVQGWLFYDEEHEPQAYATNPHGKGNWRASCWEIHPITSMEVLDVSAADNMADSGTAIEDDFEEITPTSGPVASSKSAVAAQAGQSNDPAHILSIMLLSALLGMAGQGIRVVVGLKKLNDSSESKEHFDTQFDLKKLVFSIIYAALIGIVAGILMAVNNLESTWDKTTILAVIAAGYAGVDFIEGFMSKSLPSSPAKVVTGQQKRNAAGDGPIEQP